MNTPGTSVRLGDVLSPELALVDPELASRARSRLPDRPAQVRPVATVQAHAALAVRAAADEPFRAAPRPETRRPLSLGNRRAVAVAAVASVVVLALVTGRESPPRDAFVAQPVRVDSGGQGVGTQADAPVPKKRSGTPPPKARAESAVRPQGRRFVWLAEPGATGYQVELFRDSTLVYRSRSTKPEVTIPPSWTIGGKMQRLSEGTYRWYVWPIVDGRRAAQAIVQSTLVVPASL